MNPSRAWILALLCSANGVLAVAIADRAATLRRSWQAYEVRQEAQTRLKYRTHFGGRASSEGKGDNR
jgi:hypothetical protein